MYKLDETKIKEETITYSQAITQSIKKLLKNHLNTQADETKITEKIITNQSINQQIN